jgi:hypothetical protein
VVHASPAMNSRLCLLTEGLYLFRRSIVEVKFLRFYIPLPCTPPLRAGEGPGVG